MKYKEAVGQMAGYLSTFEWFHDRHPDELVDLAIHVLNGAEKIGMLPPEIVVGATDGGYAAYRNDWEYETK